jgi:DNA helicase-2/ATP-dependent DNA helicase PcrA
LVPEISHEGQAVGVALEERAIAHRLIGEAAFFQRAEIRDVLAWLRLLADPTDAGAVVRALARPPVELRSVDIARCTQIARRRKLDMVSALAAATEAPQVPPEARERIRVFLKLYRAGSAALDTSRPDLYVHRLIERLGLRR